VKLLLEKGANMESKDTRHGRMPLSWTAENGHEAVVKLLLEKGVDVECKSDNSRMPLCWATWNGHEAVVKLLLEKAPTWSANLTMERRRSARPRRMGTRRL
jgi:ankyrin repeat protein